MKVANVLAGFPIGNYSLYRPSVHPVRTSMFWLVGCSSAAYLCQVCACWFLQGMISREKGVVSMNAFPVAGVDVSKHFSDMCILTPANEVFNRVKIYHDPTSMDRALGFLQCAEQQFAAKPVIVMESTSHYHLLLFQFFSDAGYEVIVVNPLQSNALKNISVRKIKTDKVDAYRLALLYRMNVLRRSQIPTDMLRSLRMLCRQHYELKGDITRYKNRLTALLDQTFPGFSEIFSDPAAAGALSVLERHPTPSDILTAAPSELAQIVQKASRKSSEYGSQKAALLLNCAEQAMRIGIHAPGDSILMRAIITVLRQLIESVRLIDQRIKSLAAQEAYIQKNVTLLQTIPGVGLFSAAVLLSEIGDFSLFRKPKQLAAYFGLDPSERQSGTIQSVRNQISKRGSPYVRSVLYMIAHNTVHANRFGSVGNPVLAEFYQKKCQCKPPNVAICAVMHKLSNIIYAVLRDQAPFELRAPEIHASMICRKAA